MWWPLWCTPRNSGEAANHAAGRTPSLFDYIDIGAMICPDDPWGATRDEFADTSGGSAGRGKDLPSYGLTYYLSYEATNSRRVKLDNVIRPSEKILFSDSGHKNPGPGIPQENAWESYRIRWNTTPNGGPFNCHGEGGNISFVDGHAVSFNNLLTTQVDNPAQNNPETYKRYWDLES